MERILIIGGGGTGAALAHDLLLRGFNVALFEKGEFFSGTTGRNHGLLHSGGRYAVHDTEAARECIEENRILRNIAPQALEQNEGLFVAVDDEDMAYKEQFIPACMQSGIPVRELSREQARKLEPNLTDTVLAAVQVPDSTLDAWRLPLHFLATAKANGASLHNFTEVTALVQANSTVTGVVVRNLITGEERVEHGDIIVNACGPWAGTIAELADVNVPIQPGPGVMVAVEGRFTNMVINRMRPAGEGDIIVPQRNLSVLGTSMWLVDKPDDAAVPAEHIQRMYELCALLVPAVSKAPMRSAWSAARPLIIDSGAATLQQMSRTFDCFDHQQRDGVEGFVSIIGGKAMTCRAMAETTADTICAKLGRHIPCTTKTTPLLPYRALYTRG